MHHFAQVTFSDQGCFQAVAEEKFSIRQRGFATVKPSTQLQKLILCCY